MIFFLVIIIAIIFYGMQVKEKDRFHTDYCSKKQTATVNAIFSLLIFLSHSAQYTTLGGPLDEPYLAFRKYIGQIVVASFLLYSGFGIMESINKKGSSYAMDIPKKRFFRLWYHYAIVVAMFIIVGLIFKRHYELKDILLAFTAYTSVGNSNWYLFVTFAMYIIIFVSFFVFRKNKYIAVGAVILLTGVFAAVEYKAGMGTRYYNTIFCFPAGMVFSLLKPYIDKIVMKNDTLWSCGFAVLFAAFYIASRHRGSSFVFNIFAILAVAMIMMINMKVKIENPILDFFGNHIFSFFILQRIPMIILSQLGLSKHKYVFIIASFIATVCIAPIFDNLMAKLDSKIYKA